MDKKGKCTKCNSYWYKCDNCGASGCGNSKCGNYQWRDLHAIFANPKCRTCGRT